MEYTKEQLTEAKRQIISTIHKLREALRNFESKEEVSRYKSQITLAKRRIDAFEIAVYFIETELLVYENTHMSVEADSKEDKKILFSNIEKLHTTELGIQRIKKNLSLDTDEVVKWCKEKIQKPNASIIRKGKNWYIDVEGCIITINAHSYTVITGHMK